MTSTITCEGVRTGGVPEAETLAALAQQGIKTLIDLREPGEATDNNIETYALQSGMKYLRLPVSKTRVDISQIDRFKDAVANAGATSVYAFSSGGKRPAGILCFLACARVGDSVIEVFRKAKNYGCSIDKESALKTFILDFYSSHRGDMLNNYFQHHPAR